MSDFTYVSFENSQKFALKTVKTEELGVTDEKYVQGLSGMSERIALAASVCELSEFRWFRMELVYPPVCSLIAFECELPAD